MSEPGTCGSCGRDGETDLEDVRRVYVLAEMGRDVDEAVADGRIRISAEVEPWCGACRLQFPHQPAEA